MAVTGMESAILNGWSPDDGNFTGFVDVNFGKSSICAQSTLSMSFGSVQHVTGVQGMIKDFFFGGPTAIEFGLNPWEWPNAVFDDDIIQVTFGISVWDDSLEAATAVANIFFFG